MSVYLLKILTPEKKIYEDSVSSVTITGAEGQLTVLGGHAPMAAVIAEGAITIRTEQEDIEGITGRGMLWVERNEATVMVHDFHWADEEVKPQLPEAASADELYHL